MTINPTRTFTLLAPVALAFLAGCSTYIGNYHYSPRPAVALVPATQPSDPPALACVSSVVGVHRANGELKIPDSVEVRFRLENNGPQTVAFDPVSMQLLSGGLMDFPPPILHPGAPVTLSPAQSAMVSAYFPFPPGRSLDSVDMDSLQLRWVVQFDGRPLPQAANFQRIFPAYYRDPYWDDYYYYGPRPWFGFYGGGIFIGGHRR